jgi:hypothetical protein
MIEGSSIVDRHLAGLRLADVEEYLATLRGNELFQGRYFVSATAGTTGGRGVLLWTFREWDQQETPPCNTITCPQ